MWNFACLSHFVRKFRCGSKNSLKKIAYVVFVSRNMIFKTIKVLNIVEAHFFLFDIYVDINFNLL